MMLNCLVKMMLRNMNLAGSPTKPITEESARKWRMAQVQMKMIFTADTKHNRSKNDIKKSVCEIIMNGQPATA